MRYATLRSVHGVLALVLATLLAVYVVSGFMLIHGVGGWRPSVFVSVPIAAIGGQHEEVARVRATAVRAAARAGLEDGRARRPKFVDGAWRVNVRRVAHFAGVTLTPGAPHARVELRQAGLKEGIKQLHRVTAKGARGARLAWVVLIDALALALLVFSLTGLWLFVRLKRKRRLGWVLLGASSLYTLGGIAWLALYR